VFKAKRTLNKVSKSIEKYGVGIWAHRAAEAINLQLDTLSSPLPPLATMQKETLVVCTERLPAQTGTGPDLETVAEYLASLPTAAPTNFINLGQSQSDFDTELLAPDALKHTAYEEDTHSVLDAPLSIQIPTNPQKYMQPRFGGSEPDHGFVGSLGPHLPDYSQIPTESSPPKDIEFARSCFDGSENDLDFFNSFGPHLPDNFWLPHNTYPTLVSIVR
jgi:hypothetical protein